MRCCTAAIMTFLSFLVKEATFIEYLLRRSRMRMHTMIRISAKVLRALGGGNFQNRSNHHTCSSKEGSPVSFYHIHHMSKFRP